MAIKTRNGFQLSGHVNGNVNPPAHMYQKATTFGQDSVVFVGDPIHIVSAGTVIRAPLNTSAAPPSWDTTGEYLGVCTGIFETEDGRPLTHRTKKYSATADTAWIAVIDDPDAVWEASYGATANQTVLGSFTGVQYDSPTSAAGISGAGLSSANPGTTSKASQFRVIDVVNLQRDGANASNADQDGRVRVVANRHVFRSTNTN